jgi:hypothetical protein
MKMVGRIFGALCAVTFVVVLGVAIVRFVRGDPAFDYGLAAIALLLLAVGAERYTQK